MEAVDILSAGDRAEGKRRRQPDVPVYIMGPVRAVNFLGSYVVLCTSVSLSVCPSASLWLEIFVSVPVCVHLCFPCFCQPVQRVYLSLSLSVYVSAHLSVSLSRSLFMQAYLCLCLSICPYLCLSVSTSVKLSLT